MIFFRIRSRLFRLFLIQIRDLDPVSDPAWIYSNIIHLYKLALYPAITTRYNFLSIVDFTLFLNSSLCWKKGNFLLCTLLRYYEFSPGSISAKNFGSGSTTLNQRGFGTRVRLLLLKWHTNSLHYHTYRYIAFSSKQYATAYFNDNTIRQNIYFNCKCAKQRSKRKSL